MNLETWAPEGPLSDAVETILQFTDFEADYSVERIIPTGAPFLLMELDGITRYVLDDRSYEKKQAFRGVWLSGVRRRFLTVSVPPKSSMLVCQFKPLGAYSCLKFPLHQLNDTVTPSTELFGNELDCLRIEVLGEPDVRRRFRMVADWLLGPFEARLLPPDDVFAVLAKLQNHPFSRHESLVAEYPKTRKHLIAQFRKFGGLSPKMFHRIFRFNGILAAIREKRSINWSDIAFETGFADQSHFVRAFKEFSGLNPSEFIGRGYDHQEPNFFPMDRG